ncbi:MAG TPA: hypothetical protein VGL12_00375 [Roseiarcus sp.]|jgi:hypothetical protein
MRSRGLGVSADCGRPDDPAVIGANARVDAHEVSAEAIITPDLLH